MKIILLILLFPLVKCIFPRISFSCLLLGNYGCELKCSLKCLLLDCVPQNSYCDGCSRCECNEIYNMGDTTLTNDDFENLDFVKLWNTIFESNEASAKILNRIKKDDNLEAFLITLLRDPYMTGEDIISVLKNEYPTWKAVNSLVSFQHGLKTEIMEPGKHIQYNDLDMNMDKLLDLIDKVPPDGMDNSRYKLRVKNLLKNITQVEDLEEIIYIVKLSGNKSLYKLIKSSLINLGYGFEEDGDSPIGKKAILKNISVDIEDAGDDEKLEIALTKKFEPKKSGSNSPTKQKIMNTEDIDNVFTQETQTTVSTGESQNSIKHIGSNVSTPAPIPASPMQYSGIISYPSATSAWSQAAKNGYGNSIGYDDYGNAVTGYERYENSISNGGQKIAGSTKEPTLYILLVDAYGNVIQANEIPKNPVPTPAYTP